MRTARMGGPCQAGLSRGQLLLSRPRLPLLASVGGIVALAILLPYTPLDSILGFVRPPPAFYVFLAAVVVTYLALVEVVKQAFYRRYG